MLGQPPEGRPGGQNEDGQATAKSKSWLLPCELEQYRCYAPVCASSTKLIRTCIAAHRATGDVLHLQKARALAGTLTHSRENEKAPGRCLTWLMKSGGPIMWFNYGLYAVRVMQDLAEVEESPMR